MWGARAAPGRSATPGSAARPGRGNWRRNGRARTALRGPAWGSYTVHMSRLATDARESSAMAPARNRRGRRAAQATGEALATGEGLTTSKGLAEKDAEAAPALTLVPTDAGAPVSPLAGDAEIGRAGALQATSATATKEVLLSDAAQTGALPSESLQPDAGHPEPVQAEAMQAAADTGTPVEAA